MSHLLLVYFIVRLSHHELKGITQLHFHIRAYGRQGGQGMVKQGEAVLSYMCCINGYLKPFLTVRSY